MHSPLTLAEVAAQTFEQLVEDVGQLATLPAERVDRRPLAVGPIHEDPKGNARSPHGLAAHHLVQFVGSQVGVVRDGGDPVEDDPGEVELRVVRRPHIVDEIEHRADTPEAEDGRLDNEQGGVGRHQTR